MTTKSLILLTLFLLGGLFASGQDRTSPKKIRTKGDYTHSLTNFIFPEKFETYSRQAIYSFNKKNSNIGIVYENQNIGKTTISIYLYPAGNEGSEGRLRHEYLKSMQEIANSANGFGASQFPVKQDGEFLCNGFKAVGNTNSNEINNLTVFECGTWFLKIRVTTNELDSNQVAKIESQILEKYKPSDLTKLKPLNTKANIYFAKAAFADSLMLGSIMGSAFKKLEWANQNLKENEKSSGFPDIYLQMHVESLKELLLFKNKNNYKMGEASKKYLGEVALLVSSGFLPEFIMKQFNMVLIVPDKQTFDFDGYEKWRQTNNLTLDLNKRYYVISYGEK